MRIIPTLPALRALFSFPSSDPDAHAAIMNSNFDPATEKYVSLATYRRNGAEVKTPVWIAKVAGRYYVFSAGDAGKVKRIRATPRVRIAPCDVRGEVRGPWIEAHARIVVDPTLIVEVRKALRSKYGLVMRFTDVIATMTGRIRRRAYIEMELADSYS
jgi:PPOX class probable F420-dependent enzyme